MTDREKVINGLDCCLDVIRSRQFSSGCCFCPYADEDRCNVKMIEDAIAKLKEQEPRLMTYDEMMKAEICFLEVKGIEEINPFIRFEVDDKSYWSSPYTNNKDYPFEMLAEQGEYLINARCWTSRPTDEQREATQWAK